MAGSEVLREEAPFSLPWECREKILSALLLGHERVKLRMAGPEVLGYVAQKILSPLEWPEKRSLALRSMQASTFDVLT